LSFSITRTKAFTHIAIGYNVQKRRIFRKAKNALAPLGYTYSLQSTAVKRYKSSPTSRPLQAACSDGSFIYV